jgi:hypothetical protein
VGWPSHVARITGRCSSVGLAFGIVLALLLSGSESSPAILRVLPRDAEILETAIIQTPTYENKGRMLVLWQIKPQLDFSEDWCGNVVYGRASTGLTRVSLVSVPEDRLINTLEIWDDELRPERKTFSLPRIVASSGYYLVPHPRTGNQGVPRILNLSDFTGSGSGSQFALFAYVACGIVDSSVFGYSIEEDRVVQYRVNVYTNGHGPKQHSWIQQVFAVKPVARDHWDFTWQPGHGTETNIHDNVVFDKKMKMFIENETISKMSPQASTP